MRILYCKTFGIGNAVMAVPAIKALGYLYAEATIDILVGNTPDDVGALEVLSGLIPYGQVDHVYRGAVPGDVVYDLAILAIPYDGRWRNGVHFKALRTMDGRTRPDPSTTGLVSWEKHEIEYQMDNVRELGFELPTPDTEFFSCSNIWKNQNGAPDSTLMEKHIYLGLGYKKDAAGFWKVKHWGNENYAKLVQMILAQWPDHRVVTTGDMLDLQLSVNPIANLVKDERFAYVPTTSLDKSFIVLNSCGMYVGNDTGMMHVADSCRLKTLGLFFMENSARKSHPWKGQWIEAVGRKLDPQEVFERIKEMKA